jgi:hypothetical protein
MTKLLELLYIELKTVPFTFAMLLILWVMVARLTQDHVSVAQFVELQTEIKGVQRTLKQDHLDTRLHSTQKELFDIGQRIKELQAKNLPVDDLIVQRQETLREDEQDLQREMVEARK